MRYIRQSERGGKKKLVKTLPYNKEIGILIKCNIKYDIESARQSKCFTENILMTEWRLIILKRHPSVLIPFGVLNEFIFIQDVNVENSHFDIGL